MEKLKLQLRDVDEQINDPDTVSVGDTFEIKICPLDADKAHIYIPKNEWDKTTVEVSEISTGRYGGKTFYVEDKDGTEHRTHAVHR